MGLWGRGMGVIWQRGRDLGKPYRDLRGSMGICEAPQGSVGCCRVQRPYSAMGGGL